MEYRADFLIERFGLKPLPIEGGLFHRHYGADETIPAHALPPRYTHPKLFGSAILYMHTPQTRSLLHRLKTDEIYHFYAGDPVSLVLLYPEGRCEVVTLGQDYAAGQVPVRVVPRGVWQGSCLAGEGRYALMGTTLAPAYDDDDFELGEPGALRAHYPEAVDWVDKLT